MTLTAPVTETVEVLAWFALVIVVVPAPAPFTIAPLVLKTGRSV